MVGIVATTVALIAVAYRAFPDSPPGFRGNATIVVALPLVGLALLLAALIWAVRAIRRDRRIRFSVRGLILGVGLIAGGLGVVRWWVDYNFATVYSPGYDEAKFRRIKVGMAPAEVEAILGRPLQKDSTSQRWGPYEMWIYSEPPPSGTLGDNYWRRWVMLDQDRRVVVCVVADYYTD